MTIAFNDNVPLYAPANRLYRRLASCKLLEGRRKSPRRRLLLLLSASDLSRADRNYRGYTMRGPGAQKYVLADASLLDPRASKDNIPS